MNEAKTRVTKVGAVALPVTDQDRALEFYVGTLGFEKALRRTLRPRGALKWLN